MVLISGQKKSDNGHTHLCSSSGKVIMNLFDSSWSRKKSCQVDKGIKSAEDETSVTWSFVAI